MDKETLNLIKIPASIVLGLAALFFVFGSFSVIKPGNAGVVFNQMTGSLHTTSQGFAFKVPFITNVQSYPTALRTYTMVMKNTEGSSKDDDSIDLPTKEGQHIKQDLSITYNTSEDRASEVFKSFRGADIEDIENTFIRRTAITVAQNVAGQMSLSEVISSSRDKLQTSIQTALGVELTKMGFNLDKVNLGASHLPEAIEKQMQQKMAAQQEAQQAEYELLKQQTLAKATVAKAEGDASASLIRAKSEAEANKLKLQTLTPQLIQYEAVQKWSGNMPQVTGGTIPFLNLNLNKAAKEE